MTSSTASLGPDEFIAIAEAMGLASGAQLGPTSQRLDTVRGVLSGGKPYTFRNRAVEAYLTSDWPRTG